MSLGTKTFILCALIVITTIFLPGMTGIYGFVAPFIGWIGLFTFLYFTNKIETEEAKDAASAEVKKLKTKRAITLALTIVLVIVFFHSCSYESGGGSNTCSVCHKKLTDDANQKSIRRTNMCESCKFNYDAVEDALQKSEDWDD